MNTPAPLLAALVPVNAPANPNHHNHLFVANQLLVPGQFYAVPPGHDGHRRNPWLLGYGLAQLPPRMPPDGRMMDREPGNMARHYLHYPPGMVPYGYDGVWMGHGRI